MNKSEYLGGLRRSLAGLPGQEIDRTVAFYGEIIDERMEEGLSEEDAVRGMEAIDVIARRLHAEFAPEAEEPHGTDKPRSKGKGALKWTLLIAGFPIWFPLLIAAGALLFSFFVVIWSLIISLVAAAFSICIAGIASIAYGAYTMVHSVSLGLISLGGGFVCAGIAVLVAYPLARFVGWLARGSIWILRKPMEWLAGLMKGEFA